MRFVLAGALFMLMPSWLAAAKGDQPWLVAVFDGRKPVVVAIIVAAVWRLARRALAGWPSLALAAAAFIALFVLRIDFPWVVLAAATSGWIAGRAGLPALQVASYHGDGQASAAVTSPPPVARPSRRVGVLIAVLAVLWALPVLAAVAVFGREPFADIAALFTKAAFVTFADAYAVLPFIADRAVNAFGWLTRDDMLNGLARAATAPSPLILVLPYVGFLAGWKSAGGELMTAAAAALTPYVTFLPSILFKVIIVSSIERLPTMAASRCLLSFLPSWRLLF